MRKLVFALLLTLPCIQSARAADADGRWGVMVITEQGSCDRGFRYPVLIARGDASYQGDAELAFKGAVAADGGFKFSFAKGATTGSGNGKMTADGDTGRWSGKYAGGNCSGRWEAKRG